MKKHINIKLIVSIILTIITFGISIKFCEPIAFNNTLSLEQKMSNKLFITIMVCFIIFVFCIWNAIIMLIEKLKAKDKKTITFLKHFCIYFGIMLIFLAIIWPGHWVWDEIFTINYTENYNVFMWQSVVTQIYYAMALLILPYPVAIVIMQIILISLVVAFIQAKVEISYKNRWLNLILYILFLLPAVIVNNLYIIRLPMYSYIMLMFFATLLFDHIQKKESITKIKAIFIYVLSAFMILWRSEGIIFIIFIPILLALNYKNIRKPLKIVAICVILVLTYFGFNKIFESNKDKSYDLLIYVNPLSNMLQEELKGNIEEDIEKIDKAMDVEVIKKHPSYSETPAYWEDKLIREDYNNNLDGISKSYAKIILNNPISFISARIKTLLASSGLDANIIPQVSNRYLWNMAESDDILDVNKFCNKHKYMNSINSNLKINVESFLIGENAETKEQNQIIKVLFWNFMPVLIGIAILTIIKLIQRDWLIVFMGLSLLAKAGIVFLTAPASYFMYYFPEYIIGFLLISVTFFEIYIQKKKGVKKSD